MGRKRASEDALQAALAAGAELARYLAGGGRPVPQTAPVRLDPGEVCLGSSWAAVAQYTVAADWVTVGSTTVVGGGLLESAGAALGDAAARSKARALTQTAWRPIGSGPLVVTDRRLLWSGDGRWTSWWLSAMRQVQPSDDGRWVMLGMDDCPATRISGPMAPWLAVMVTWLTTGEIVTPTNPHPPGR